MTALENPVLVLNRGWAAVNIISVARALVKVWSGIAQAVDTQTYQTYTWEDWADLKAEGDNCIQAVSQRIKVPEVITLVIYDRNPANDVSFSRRNIHKRDRFTCQYCGVQPGTEELTIDHIIPRAQAGETSWENCVLACITCNKSKADRTLEQAGMRLKKKPKKPQWSPLYSLTRLPVESWKKFISEAYWQVKLQ